MSEFTFSCPSCKQNILVNASVVGEKINCPNCLKLIVVPPAPASAAPGTTVAAASPTPAAQKTSGLAIASLVCSLASIITCIGWIPGIICGHIAKAKIRRNPALKGSGIATAGLVIGYLFFASQVSYIGIKIWRVSSAVKKGFTDVQHNLATNTFVTVDTTSTTNDMTQPEPSPDITTADNTNIATINVTTTADNTGDNSNWTTDPNQMAIPDHPIAGKIHGNDFALRRAVMTPAGLRLVSANRLLVEVHGLGTAIDGKSFEVQTTDAPNKIPHVQMTWPEGALEPTAAVTHGYAMKLEFGQAANGMVSGKIYLCLPDNLKSWVAGTFDVQMLKTN